MASVGQNIAYAIYHRILQHIAAWYYIGLSTQSKYASTILNVFSAVTLNTHINDIKYYLKTLMQYQ